MEGFPDAASLELVRPRAGLDDLVLPVEVRRALDGLVAAARAARPVRGLLVGPSGTGKTLAAEALAGALDRPLLRLDLGRVTSRWIGETEKNLATLLGRAERAGAVLLFDEADALFGKRTGVRDAHERYADQEVSFLLQRCERCRAAVLLAGRLRAPLDASCLDAVVVFPAPDAGLRRELWERHLPPHVDRAELDLARLAAAALSGAEIRATIVRALAEAGDEPARVAAILARAVRSGAAG